MRNELKEQAYCDKKNIIYQEDDKSKKITMKCHSNILNKQNIHVYERARGRCTVCMSSKR
jgi:hypothetical protein